MSGLATLIKLVEHRSDEATVAWQRLAAQRDDAKHKLLLLQKHGEGYRDLMRAELRHGMPAASIVAHLGFIGQIEAVVVNQEGELGQLQEACARQWQELVSLRREKRTYEILSERAAARDAVAASRRLRAEIDESLLRAVGRSAPVFRGGRFNE